MRRRRTDAGRSVATVSNGTQEEEGFKKDLIIHAQLAVARRRRGLAPEIGGGPRSSGADPLYLEGYAPTTSSSTTSSFSFSASSRL